MKTVRSYPTMTRRFYRPEQSVCPECQRHLQRAVTVSERTVITLTGVIKLIHAGYRCPNSECPAHARTYRSAAADALALPGFTDRASISYSCLGTCASPCIVLWMRRIATCSGGWLLWG